VSERINRRDFLKIGGVVASASLLTSLISPKHETSEYSRYFQDPYQLAVKRLQSPKVKLLAIGEDHKQTDMELFSAKVVGMAANLRLIDFLAVEVDENLQQDMDSYLQSSKVSRGLRAYIEEKHTWAYWQILQAARKAGIAILCTTSMAKERPFGNLDFPKMVSMDVSGRQKIGTDDFMSNMIIKDFKAGGYKKGIFHAGNSHVIKDEKDILSGELKGGAYYALMVLNATYTSNKAYQKYLEQAVTYPLAVDNVGQSPFSSFKFGQEQDVWSEYGKITDGLVFLPPKI
jgi:hypothetical protein